ncbi:hypothetical protein X754_12920 [Mesorhizobium sp. LNJC403B00]|nr:hypothetical protein X754_12920 [Mesorhizobium sp. LNJC403B00]
MVAEFATWFANRFVRQWFARYQPHDSVHALHSQTHRRDFPGMKLGMVFRSFEVGVVGGRP